MRRPRSKALLATARTALVFGASVVAAACSLLTSFDGFEGASTRTDAGDDVTTPQDDGGSSGEPCAHQTWPSPSTTGAGANDTTDVGARTSAISDLKILSTVDGGPPTVGANLDGLCTCPDAPSCRSATREPLCDPTDSGIDNAGASFFRELAQQKIALDDQGLAEGVNKGKYALLVRVTGYNGQANDPEVAVAIFNGIGLEGGATAPAFNGEDTWTIDRESYPEKNFALFASKKAWVTDSVLVAEIPTLALKLRVPSASPPWQLIELGLVDAHVTARIAKTQPSSNGFTLENGLIAGRFSAKAALKQVQINGICNTDPLFGLLKTRICGVLDMPLSPGEDGRDTPCAAISVGFAFEAKAAKLGELGDPSDTIKCTVNPNEDCP